MNCPICNEVFVNLDLRTVNGMVIPCECKSCRVFKK